MPYNEVIVAWGMKDKYGDFSGFKKAYANDLESLENFISYFNALQLGLVSGQKKEEIMARKMKAERIFRKMEADMELRRQ